MQGRLFLIDGHALIFKMYYAFLRRPMVNSKGADVSILYGFTKYVLELIEKERKITTFFLSGYSHFHIMRGRHIPENPHK